MEHHSLSIMEEPVNSELPKEQTAEPLVSDIVENEAPVESCSPHDSMVTVRLSEPPPPSLTVNTTSDTHKTVPFQQIPETVPENTGEDVKEDAVEGIEESPRITMMDPNGDIVSPSGSDSGAEELENRRESDSTEASEEGVDWEELEKTEEQEPRDPGSDDSTALLLARLEQENNLITTFATNTKVGIVQSPTQQRLRRQSRPPSIQHLKRLVNGPTPPALRYSMIPPPPMTDLEFYAALVQDYTRTAQCLPTLLSKKIRSGVPPPLRGVVWQSMSGARDQLLEDEFDKLCLEPSPYEGIIGKDLGRSFPGVEMFRDPDGDGQRMLGRVLKCFSLYDHKIGYCQGLGFLVGPLLMHMGDKQAFCILVRLMENYDLRNCFLPDLSGLHVRIYQFRKLLEQHLPVLTAHLDVLQIEPAYVSQWFLSLFAVTCPLPMLFRIYDVIFAEGVSETMMRVALSLMRKNEAKILAFTELEDVMHLLLSRGLWDVYHYNADEFVNDFVSLTVVTHESLQALEAGYRESQSANAASTSETVGSAASRFLGRLWAGSNSSTKSVNLSPAVTTSSRPVSFLRRSPSKQSIASTMASNTESIMSSSTDATSVHRDSNADGSSLRGQSVNIPKTNKDKNLHTQIEDLLTALSEMQRDHSNLAIQLQKEREDREEDRLAVRSLLDGLKHKDAHTSIHTIESIKSQVEIETVEVEQELASPSSSSDADSLPSPTIGAQDGFLAILESVESRFANSPSNRRSSMLLQSKAQLRDELARSKEQLANELSKSQDYSRRLSEQEQEVTNLRDQVREGHNHIRSAHQEKQRLEKIIHDLRARKSTSTTPDGSKDAEPDWRPATGGLRELRLGRTPSTKNHPAPFNKRSSSLNAAAIALNAQNQQENTPPSSVGSSNQASPSKDVDVDALVMELIAAKTAEAVAKEETEEAKRKLEGLRKLLGMGGGAAGASLGSENIGHRSSPSQPNLLNTSLLKRTNTMSLGQPAATKPEITAPASASAAVGGGGGFWGGWGKRTTSGTDKS